MNHHRRTWKQKALASAVTLFTAMSLTGINVTADEAGVPEDAAQRKSAAAEEAIAPEVLRMGDNNDAVRAIQEQLISLGFLNDIADGSFGPKTLDAVTKFREAYGLDAAGEVDAAMTDMLDAVFAVIHADGKPEAEPAEVVQFRTIEIAAYDDGTYYVDTDTVSNKTISDLYQILMAANESCNASETVPETDVKPALAVDLKSIPEGVEMAETILLEDLSAMAAERQEALLVTDTMGNVITANSDGSISSDTGNISVVMMDALTGEVIGEAESKAVDELTWKKPGELWLGNVKIDTDENGQFVVAANTVSEKTLQTLRNMFTSVDYAYANSTTIPADEIEMDIDNLPVGITQDQLTYNSATGTWYAGMDIVSQAAQNSGQEIEIQDARGNTVNVSNNGSVTTQSPAASYEQNNTSYNWGQPTSVPTYTPAATPAYQAPEQAAAPSYTAPASNTPAPASQSQASSSAPAPAASTPDPAPAPQPAPAPEPTPAPTPAPHTHSYTSSVTVQPTCSSTGVMTYTCSGCGDSYTETIPTTGHVTQEVPHYAIVHYLPPQYVCNACGAYFPDVDSIVGHSSMICHSGYHVDDFILDYVEDLGMNYVDGATGIGGYDVCVNCGAIVDQW